MEVGCRWSACGRRMLKESIARHILSIHLGEIWKCQGCDNKIARKDAYERHSVKSDSEKCRNAGALVTYSADVRVIDARAALDNRGMLMHRYRSCLRIFIDFSFPVSLWHIEC